WRDFAATDTRRRDNAHAGSQIELEQIVRASELAGDRVAHPHRHRRRWRLAFLNDFEMVVERRHLVHLGERKAHLLRERREMRRRQVAVVIVKLVQVLDQEIALPRRVAEKLLYVGERLCIDRPAFRDRARFAFHATLLSGSGVRGFLTAVKRLVLLGEALEDETVEAVGAALVAPAEVPE